MSRWLGKFKDYPGLTTLALGVLVVMHLAFYDVGSLLPDVADEMANSNAAWSIYMGFAGVVAISAGFAGVIIIFALGSTSPSFVRMRVKGGKRMEANWVSPVATSLFAAFGCGMCAVLRVADQGLLAWWIFEFLALLAAAAAVRLVWLFRRLVRIVSEDDRRDEDEKVQARTLAQVRRG